MRLDIRDNNAPSPRLIDARGPPLALIASCDSYIDAGETHSAVEPWIAEGISRATWYRRSRPDPESTEPRPGAMRWYVARAVHGMAEQADWEIRTAGFDVVTARIFKPAVKEHRSAFGSLIAATEQSFPLLFVRYIVVRFSLAGIGWHKIPAMDSVERIISGGYIDGRPGVPIAVPDSEIDTLRKWLHSDGCLYPKGHMYSRDGKSLGLDSGSEVTFLGGVLADHKAVYEMSDGKRASLVTGMFNRDNVRVTAAQTAVRAT